MQANRTPMPQFARTAGPHGKFTEELKTHLDEATYNQLLHKCARLNKLPGPLVRDLVYLFVHGMSTAEVQAKHDRAMLEGEGTNQGLLLKVKELSGVES